MIKISFNDLYTHIYEYLRLLDTSNKILIVSTFNFNKYYIHVYWD
jgi:hypothetical protein